MKSEDYEHYDDIHYRDGGLEEVVVVARHEFPHLVYEGAEPRAAEYGRPELYTLADKGKKHYQRDEHKQAAPQHVRYV